MFSFMEFLPQKVSIKNSELVPNCENDTSTTFTVHMCICYIEKRINYIEEKKV